MNYGKYDTICCKLCFYLLISNELSYIDPGNQLLIITITMDLITVLQPSNSMYFCTVTFYSVTIRLIQFRIFFIILYTIALVDVGDGGASLIKLTVSLVDFKKITFYG